MRSSTPCATFRMTWRKAPVEQQNPFQYQYNLICIMRMIKGKLKGAGHSLPPLRRYEPLRLATLASVPRRLITSLRASIPRRERIVFAHSCLSLALRHAVDHLITPQTLDVVQDIDDLFMRQDIPERRHPRFEPG